VRGATGLNTLWWQHRAGSNAHAGAKLNAAGTARSHHADPVSAAMNQTLWRGVSTRAAGETIASE